MTIKDEALFSTQLEPFLEEVGSAFGMNEETTNEITKVRLSNTIPSTYRYVCVCTCIQIRTQLYLATAIPVNG